MKSIVRIGSTLSVLALASQTVLHAQGLHSLALFTAVAPEIDGSVAASGAALLAGAVMIIRARRSK